MNVTRSSFESVTRELEKASWLSFDTETTGLRPHHGDRLFSIAIATSGTQTYYFNFQAYPGLPEESCLLPKHLSALQTLFSDRAKTWYAHNAQFDLAMLARENLSILGTVHCTQSIERVVFNDHPPGGYDLDSCAQRIGFAKDDAVEKYIAEHSLFTYTLPEKPGSREKNKHFDRVPFEIIAPYAERDAGITFALGQSQEKALEKIANETDPKLPSVLNILKNERRLTQTIFRMEAVGVKINREYCVQGARYEADRAEKAQQEFKQITGRDFRASGKLFTTVFESEKEKWTYGERTSTGKINPCFDSDAIKRFENPAARSILNYRDAKSRSDFFRGFLWHADRDDIIHPHFNQGGAATGRFSSSGPNFQNLTNEE